MTDHALVVGRPARRGMLRDAPSDALFVFLSVVHGVALLAVPSVPLVAIGLWWNANTVAHNFIHLPFFRSASLNRAYSVYLSVVLGLPQSLWRLRHLAHHAGRPPQGFFTRQVLAEGALVGVLWLSLLLLAPSLFLTVYLPGWLAGLTLCQLHGHYEHARGTTSHYGRLYNLLLFNDGFHVEHHARPSLHWSALSARREHGAAGSRWPAILRWLDGVGLNGLERVVLQSARLRRFVVDAHERAFRRLVSDLDIHTVTIVGGGLFPRTALVVRRVIPNAAITIVDSEGRHLDVARSFLDPDVELRHEVFDPETPVAADLVVVPLAYVGDRRAFYERPQARVVLVHDWIWSRRGRGVVVSWLLLKRLNLVLGADPPEGASTGA